MIDLTITVSVIIALCAIISPILTSLINNRHQRQLKKLEIKEQRYQETVIYKKNIFEKYLKCASRCVIYANEDSLRDYGEHYLIALMYAPEDIQEQMMKTHDMIKKHNWDDATNLLEQLTPMVTNMLQKL